MTGPQPGRERHTARVVLPAELSPMLATTGPLPPEDGHWAYEVKWDGYRALVGIDGAQFALRSRRGRTSTRDFPGLPQLRCPVPAVLDAEVVALDADGRPSFELLARRRQHPAPLALIVFDVLAVDGHLVMSACYDDRRRMLEQLGLQGAQIPPTFLEGGTQLLASTRAQGLEGVLAKRRSSAYEPGRRSPHWIKTKHVQRQSAVIIGWRGGEQGRPGRLGALLLAVNSAAGLVYAGRVGSGLSERELTRLQPLLAELGTTSPACEVPEADGRSARWVRPELVAEVQYTAWTGQGRLRHPTYQGLREDLEPEQVVRE